MTRSEIDTNVTGHVMFVVFYHGHAVLQYDQLEDDERFC